MSHAPHAQHSTATRSPAAAAAAASCAIAPSSFSSPSHKTDRRSFFLRATELAKMCDEEEEEEDNEELQQRAHSSQAQQAQSQLQTTTETQQLAASSLPSAKSARRSRVAPHSAAEASSHSAHATASSSRRARHSVAQSSRSGGQAAAAGSVALSARAARPAIAAAAPGMGLAAALASSDAGSGSFDEEPSSKRARKLDFSGSLEQGAEASPSTAVPAAAAAASLQMPCSNPPSPSLPAAAAAASASQPADFTAVPASPTQLDSLDLEMSLDPDFSAADAVDAAAEVEAAGSSSMSRAQSRSFDESSRPLSQSPSLVSSPRIAVPSSSLSSQLSQPSQPLESMVLESAAALEPPADVLIPPSSAEHSAASSQEAARVPSPSFEPSMQPPLHASPSIPPLALPSQELAHAAGRESPIPSTPNSRCVSPLLGAAARMQPLPLPLPLPLPHSQSSQSPSLHSLGAPPAPSLASLPLHPAAPSLPPLTNDFVLASAVVSPALPAAASPFPQSQQHSQFRQCTQPSSDAESFPDIELPSQLMGAAAGAAAFIRGGVMASLGSQQHQHLFHRSSQPLMSSLPPLGVSASQVSLRGLGAPASIPFHASPPIITETMVATPASSSSAAAAASTPSAAAAHVAASDSMEPAYDPFTMLAPFICEADSEQQAAAAPATALAAAAAASASAASSHLAALSSIRADYPLWLRKCESVLRVLLISRLHPFVFTNLSMLHALLVAGAVAAEAMPPFDLGPASSAAASSAVEEPLQGLAGRFEVYNERNPRPTVEGVSSGCWDWLRGVDLKQLQRRAQEATAQQREQPRTAHTEPTSALSAPPPPTPATVATPAAPVAAAAAAILSSPSSSRPSTVVPRRPASGSHSRRPPRPPAPLPLPLPLCSQESNMS